jgi:hypothetical protein
MTASQAGTFNIQEFTDLGVLGVGYRLYTYTAGTTTFKAAYTDAAATVQQTYTSDGQGGLYIALNARGELPAPLYLTSGSYDLALKRTDGSTVWTRRAEPIADSVSAAATFITSLASASGSALVGFIQAGIGAVAMTLQTLLRQIVTTKQFGAVADSVTNDAAAVLAASNRAVAIGAPLVIQGVHNITSAITITAPIVDTLAQMFTPGSLVTIDNGLPVRPEWWGSGQNTVHLAGLSLPAAGGVVQLSSKTYQTNNHVYGGKYWSKDNVTFRGAAMPTPTTDCKALQNGTIIQGSWLSFANNCAYENLGCDAGYTYTQGIAGGIASDAFSASYGNDAQKTANASVRGLRLHNVIGLCNGPNDPYHALILAEATYDTRATGKIVGIYGVHGVIIKAQGVRCDTVEAYCNNAEGVIIKTDAQTTAVAFDVQIGNVVAFQGGPVGCAPYAVGTNAAGSLSAGLRFHCFGGSVSKVQIGNVQELGHDVGVDLHFDGAFVLDDIQIGSITTDGNATTGFNGYLTAAGWATQRCQFGRMVNRNTPTGAILAWQTASMMKFESIHGVNCTIAAVASTAIGAPIIDVVTAENCGAAYQLSSTAKILAGKTILLGSTTVYTTAVGGGLAPSLSNSWAQVTGGDAFNVIPAHYGVELNGLISSGTTNVVTTLPPWARPATEKRFMVQGRAAGTQAAIPVQITTAGVVTINDAAGGIANVSNYLSLAGISYSLTN